jgi:predicted GIY-YIG superfamily endonuclease
MYYTYILKLSNGSYYCGSSADVKERLKSHKRGENISTKNYRPFMLV